MTGLMTPVDAIRIVFTRDLNLPAQEGISHLRQFAPLFVETERFSHLKHVMMGLEIRKDAIWIVQDIWMDGNALEEI